MKLCTGKLTFRSQMRHLGHLHTGGRTAGYLCGSRAFGSFHNFHSP